MFDTFRNAWKTPDLRKRILYTFLILLLFRLGCAITVPFINPNAIKSWIDSVQGSALNYMSMLSGGDYERATLFALGVQPYINASIIMQLLTVAIPALENISKEGPEGQQRINRYSRYFGGALAVVLGIGYYFVIRRAGALQYGSTASMFDQIFTAVVIVAAFAAGSMLLTWMGEQIDSKGVGNGVSFIIFAGIVSRWSGFGSTIKTQLEMAKEGQPSKYVWLVVFAILALLATVLVVLLNSSERRIPVQYAKKVVGRKMYGGQSSFIPIKINMSGVMPVIFASSLTQLPSVIITLFGLSDADKHPIWSAIGQEVSSAGWIYAIVYALFIIFFNYFYVAITYNPIEISNNIRRNNGSIPGIRPGKPTTEYITRVISKVTLIGAVFLILVAVGPIVLARISGLTGMSIGGTSLLIVVGVALDTSRSLESFMLMKHHKGFLE